ncbi:response regulator CheY-like domain-containing protein [Rhizobium phaseoli]|uniref:Probable two-component response regulator protein n=1 Tax=Rhizobium etli (strain CIAT 652) TaxID=491916 RepID=B3PXC8_RHIE6|nr:response regulator transcription factor [Rhizobium phaseoli]ACE92509.1 probable two-component response regulator protein [Rhizobium etli CIAT 652]MDH6646395.1 DNA-binding response OmpR family regulator [Rhizobium esperanzae]ANL29281.1 response regulator CheY-like domain-containing protein [Rhizobium phaseoli]MDK4728206.1 response regulator transcription factor [Rhizobium phaseoli]NKE90636.1 response regulator transcription factor [Rhizobium phaseoli]
MAEPALPRDIVLLVDDSPEALGFLTDALEHSGFAVLIATSGTAALGIVERITPDLILLDAVMPAMDGFETCRRLKANAAVAQVPVIFMTGLTETEHVVHALESGGVDYLSKPINIDELRARIRVHLRNARSTQSARVALDAAGRHLLAVKSDGAIHWSTPQATRLVNAAMGSDDGMETVVHHIAGWMRDRVAAARDGIISIAHAGQAALQLAFLGAIGPDEYLFRLTAANQRSDDEVLRQRFSLTQRESEVLLWIAKGKPNRDIGEILGLSARTVNKHLEQIYVKLGVENRASAAVKATHVLHEM